MKAIEIMNEKTQNASFFVFSDDIEWAKEHIKIPSVYFISATLEDFESLFLMSKCKSNIIANSTFSFWGAWLNQNPTKIVIAPKVWNTTFLNDFAELCPPEWIKI
jgi:hypothetical protein